MDAHVFVVPDGAISSVVFLGSNPSLSATREASDVIVGGFSTFGRSFYGLPAAHTGL
jgi:hypothetical protein